MTTQLLQLGEFQFSVSTAAYDELRRETEVRWQSIDVVGGLQHVQDTGWSERITLTGTVYGVLFNAGVGQLDALRAEQARRVPLLLITGAGEVLGYYVILRVSETQSAPIAGGGGAPQKQVFTVDLQRVPDA